MHEARSISVDGETKVRHIAMDAKREVVAPVVRMAAEIQWPGGVSQLIIRVSSAS